MIKTVEYPNQYSFSGNPMMVTITGDDYDEVILSIAIDGKNVIDLSLFLFDDSGTFKGNLDISNIFTPFFEDYHISTDNIVGNVNDFILNYSISIKNHPEYDFSGKALYGGISNTNYVRLKFWDWDMFHYRLRNDERQFLFTTRTNSNHIVLRENELQPFVFIHPGKTISVVTSSGRVMILPSFPQDAICALNFSELRKAFVFIHNELPSFFAIKVDHRQIFDVTLIPNTISEETYMLRFRNSLGTFEQVEVIGKATDQTSFSEENTWREFNQNNFFEEKRTRVLSRQIITAEAGYKSKEELSFLLDLIKSDKIYFTDLSDPNLREYPCHITPEELNIPRQITEPCSISLKIRFLTEDLYQSPDIAFDIPTGIFENITTAERPFLNADGLIYGDETALHSE